MNRKKSLHRKTNETDISLEIDLDKTTGNRIDTTIPFFNHMLEAFSKHSGFDLTVKAKGDIDVDFHHTIEDTGIVLGDVFCKALADKNGIARFGEATLPLDEALSRVSLDLSGRSFFYFGVNFTRTDDGNNINPYIFEEFFRAFSDSAKINLHIDSIRGNNSHHILESVFKAFAKALSKAVQIDGNDIPSTKGTI